MKQKIFVILHLCLAFTYLFWLLLQPSLKDYLFHKTQESLFKGVFEREEAFRALPEQTQATLLEGLPAALAQKSPPYLHELGRLFFYETNGFALAWLFFSIVICLLLLYRIEGAQLAAWLLPILILTYGCTLTRYRAEDSVFPSEKYVMQTYQKERKEPLIHAWHRYLVAEWAREEPESETELFDKQVERGLYAFNVQRAKKLINGKGRGDLLTPYFSPPSLLHLFLYLAWNVLFAWMVQDRSKSVAASHPA